MLSAYGLNSFNLFFSVSQSSLEFELHIHSDNA